MGEKAPTPTTSSRDSPSSLWSVHQKEKFFLYLPYCVPHAKYQFPQDKHGYEKEDWKPNEKSHAAMVTRLDRDVGRLLDLLDALSLSEKTIVFFCSDNGAAERWEGRFDSSGQLRGRKRDMTEGGLRTPMIVRWKGTVSAGRTTGTPWWFADVLPTCAELAGAKAPGGLDGISVVESLRGNGESPPDRHFYWEFHERGFDQAVRWKGWKAIRRGKGGSLELYRLIDDPGEKKNLAAHHPGVVRKMEELMVSSRTESREWPRKP